MFTFQTVAGPLHESKCCLRIHNLCKLTGSLCTLTKCHIAGVAREDCSSVGILILLACKKAVKGVVWVNMVRLIFHSNLNPSRICGLFWAIYVVHRALVCAEIFLSLRLL